MLERLEVWQASLPVPCQVLLMPAVRDAYHHPTFPQPAVNLMAQDQVGASWPHDVTMYAQPCDAAVFLGRQAGRVACSMASRVNATEVLSMREHLHEGKASGMDRSCREVGWVHFGCAPVCMLGCGQ